MERIQNFGLGIDARDNVVIIPTTFKTDGPDLLKPPIDILPNPPDVAELASTLERAFARSGRIIERPGGQSYREPAMRAAGCRKESEYIKGLKHVSLYRSDDGFSVEGGLPTKHGAFLYGYASAKSPGRNDFLAVAQLVVDFLSDDQKTPPHPGLRARAYPKAPSP